MDDADIPDELSGLPRTWCEAPAEIGAEPVEGLRAQRDGFLCATMADGSERFIRVRAGSTYRCPAGQRVASVSDVGAGVGRVVGVRFL
jgi:hypothetical protein